MSVYNDKQYDLTWEEQDKIKRRQEIKNKLKLEYIRKYNDPFLQMQGHVGVDPAVERFMAMRKAGRLPGTPLSFKRFIIVFVCTFLPVPAYGLYYKNHVKEFNRKVNSGELPYEERKFRRWTCY